MNCFGYTYFPHSNEYGPHTLLALHIMALHPSPHPHMLLPMMHPNLAQIGRAWIATVLVTGMYSTSGMMHLLQMPHCNVTRISNRATSYPYEVIQWNHTIHPIAQGFIPSTCNTQCENIDSPASTQEFASIRIKIKATLQLVPLVELAKKTIQFSRN
jgi:hypothetical protein